ncbi:FkbM family methyltransferase [Halostella salina]|uniref:FkbM family methyltransferase n=1 Tax=Halostella salina TaxID=1547897 RepID=UPI000EF8035C|nr:FkbM family methyltransferase [Halostella salina]
MKLSGSVLSLSKSTARSVLRMVGLGHSYDENIEFYMNILRGGLAVKGSLNIIQVGANDGKYGDPIFDFVKNNKDNINVILIEPQEKLIPYLKENYKSHPSVEILNKAVTLSDEDYIKLYRIKEEYWSDVDASYGHEWPDYRIPTGVTTSDKNKLLSWASNNIDSNSKPESIIEGVRVETYRPSRIISESDIIDDVDLLQVDTEGMDDKVVYSFLEDEICPNIINIEDIHLNQSQVAEFDKRLNGISYEIHDYSDLGRIALNMSK